MLPSQTPLPTASDIESTSDLVSSEDDTVPDLIMPELEPPDGGWGWMVASALAIMFISTTGTWSSFGLIFGHLVENSLDMALVNSVFPAVGYFTGLVVNPLFRRFSFRQIGVMGGVLYFSGSLLSAFVTKVYQLVITYGVVQGLGMGLLVTASSSSFNSYFTRHKGAAMTVAMAATAVGVMVYPLLIEALQQTYGFRGTQALLAALSLHAALAMLLLEPVAHHLVPTVPITITVSAPDEEIARTDLYPLRRYLPLLVNSPSSRCIHRMASKNALDFSTDGSKKDSASDVGNAVSIRGGENVSQQAGADRQLFLEHLNLDVNMASHNTGSFQFLDNVFNARVYQSSSSSNITSGSTSTEHIKGKSTWWPRLLAEPAYLFIAVGVAMAEFSDFTFLLLQPLFFMSLGMTRAEAAWCVSLGGATDLTGRLFLALLGVFVKRRSRRFYLAGAICTMAIRAVYVPVTGHFAITLLTGLHGFFRCWMNVPLSHVFSTHCTTELYNEAFGLFFIISGMVFLISGPLVGLLHDWTGSYMISMLVLTGLMLLHLVTWLLEANIVRLRRPWN